MRRLFLAVAATLLMASASAQEDPIGSSYRIGPRDQIQIHVLEMEDLNQEVTVAEDGTVNLPLVGTLEAPGVDRGPIEHPAAQHARKPGAAQSDRDDFGHQLSLPAGVDSRRRQRARESLRTWPGNVAQRLDGSWRDGGQSRV